ncbi:MAG: RluA family pseudouridine synthase [Oscillospiraceae bacterium]|nr:RluA family pseudouridine synthase [Oscillospiraceae bacterium]
MRTITIGINDAGQRLDKFLMKLLPDMPKSLLYKLIRKKDIRCNGTRCKGTEILEKDDILTLYIKDEFFKSETSHTFSRASGKIRVIYEDSDILIVYKPKGMYAHGGNDRHAVSLIAEIQKYLFDKGEYQPDLEQTFSPALCNRIDRNTEGLVIAAKNAQALRTMNEAIRDRKVDKSYLAVTSAPLPKKLDTCTAWLKKESGQNMVEIRAKCPDKSWQKICTRYHVLAQNGRYQLVHIDLLTGRTHQIRAHLAYLGAPLLGDPKYGAKHRSNEENQCLCAYMLRFTGFSNTALSHLDGKEIRCELPDFAGKYFPDTKL